jgi:nicotinate-nucleotide adenylyltransferase
MTSGLSNVEISGCELESAGVSYTYLTLNHFQKSEQNLYFALGTDNIPELHRWKNIDVIAKLCTLYFVPRPNYEVTDEDIETLKNLFVMYEFADFTGEDGSSSLLKIATAFGKESEVVPPCVSEYLKNQKAFLDYEYITSAYRRFGLKQTRIEHIYRTAKAAIVLAKKNGVDVQKAARAALLHDIGKSVSLQSLVSSGVSFDPEAFTVHENIQHCFVGEYLARAYLNETDEDVLNAIKYHTTGKAEMSPLACVIFCADFIEEGRKFDGIEEIRRLTYRDMKAGMIKIIEHTKQFLNREGLPIDPRTQECYEWLKGE